MQEPGWEPLSSGTSEQATSVTAAPVVGRLLAWTAVPALRINQGASISTLALRERAIKWEMTLFAAALEVFLAAVFPGLRSVVESRALHLEV